MTRGDSDERRLARREIRRRRALERQVYYAHRREWILYSFRSERAYRTYLRSFRYEYRDRWDIGPRVQYWVEEEYFDDDGNHYHDSRYEEYTWRPEHDTTDHTILPQSGDDEKFYSVDHKAASRSAKTRSRASRNMEREKFKQARSNKEWSAKVRQQMRKDLKKSNSVYQPESGLFSFLKSDDLDDDLSKFDVYGKRFEDLMLYLTTATSCVNIKQFVLATLTYVKTFTDKSVSLSVFRYIVNIVCGDHFKDLHNHPILDADLNDLSLDELAVNDFLDAVPESGTDYAAMFCQGLRSLSSNFKSVAANPVFSKISYILSAAMCMGLLENTKLKWTVAGVTLFSQQAFLRQVKAHDLICAVCDTFTYFVEGGIEFFRTGSIAGFIYSDNRVSQLNDDICFLRSNIGHVKNRTLLKATGMSHSDYDNLLTKTTKNVKDLARSLEGFERTVMSQKLQRLYDVRAEFDNYRVTGGSREAPYTIQLYGPTKVGKSNLTPVLAVAIGKMNGFCVDDDRIVTLNADDKFQSNMRGDTNVIIIDDLFNTKPDFLQTAPTSIITTIANNARAYCNMAEADMKGKIPYENKLLIVSTNLEDMGASIGSNEPASIQRRAHLKIDVSVRKKFKSEKSHVLDHKKVSAHYASLGIDPPVIEDLWLFNVTEPVVVPGGPVNSKDVVKYETVVFEGKSLEAVSLKTMLRFIKQHSAFYYRNEESMVARQNNLTERIHLCKACGELEFCCTCVPIVETVPESLFSSVLDAEDLKSKILTVCKSFLYYTPDWFLALMVRYYFGLTPTATTDFALNLQRTSCFFFAMAIGNLIGLNFVYSCATLLCLFVAEHTMRDYVCSVLSIVEHEGIMAYVCKMTRQKKLALTLASMGTLVGAYYLAKKYVMGNSVYRVFAQGSLSPTCEEDVLARDKEANVWAKVKVPDRSVPRELATATVKQVSDCVFNNLCVLRIQEGERFRMCNAFVVKSNVFIMPYHMLFPLEGPNDEPDGLQVSLQRREPQTGGATVTGYLGKSHWTRVEGTDFLVVSFPNMGSYADLSKLLPDCKHNGPSLFLHKNADGSRRQEGVYTKPCKTKHSQMSFDGYEYFVAGGTHPGLCMSALITQTIGPRICGFHLGGSRSGDGRAVGGFITRKQFDDAVERLISNSGEVPIFLPHNAAAIPETQYGKPLVTTEELNPKSPLNFLEDSDGVVPLGSCNGGVTATSRVSPTYISDSVAKHTGVEQQWGAPNFRPSWRPWWETMSVVSSGAPGFNQDSVDWAIEDYCKPVFELLDKEEYARKMCGKLDMVQTINGIPGVRFIDAMVSKTSAGFPLSGPKEQFFEHLGPQGEYADVVMPNAEVLEEVERLKSRYLTCERGYPVYKASLKDESTKLGKDKVRVIYCAPIAMQILARMYFLPITRLFQTHSTLCESAVGVNCASPEWQELKDYCTDFGKNVERGFGVDYSRYDSRMPAQISIAINRILMAIAKRSKQFSEEDLLIMEGILTDATFPLVAFNGTLVEYLLSLISGDTITVHRNNLGNSTLQRIGFFEIEVKPRREAGDPLESESFRDNVRSVNYGDDVEGATGEQLKHFNMKTFAECMGKHGVQVTMPDKSAEMKEFMHWDEMDFLKRRDSYIPEIGQTVGKLELNSIFKSLHSRLVSKNVSKEEHACAVLEGAAGELFLHGRETYEDVVAKLKLVTGDHDLFVPGLQKSFDERVEDWHVKYSPRIDEGDMPPLVAGYLLPDDHEYDDDDITVEGWYGDVDDVPEEIQSQFRVYVSALVYAEAVERQYRDFVAYCNALSEARAHVRTKRALVMPGVVLCFALCSFFMGCATDILSRAALSVILVPPTVLVTAPSCAGLQLVYPGIYIPEEADLAPVPRLLFVSVIGLAHTVWKPGNFINDCLLRQRGTDHSTQTSGNQGVDAPTSENYISSISSQSFGYSSSEDEIVPQFGFGAYNITQNTQSAENSITQHSDINPGHTYEMGDISDSTYGVADMPEATLQSFFQRPIQIYDLSWPIAAAINVDFNPWREYLNNVRVSNRVSNFRNLRGRLHLKFVLNGNQFYYGLLVASYRPRPVNDDFTVYSGDYYDLIQQSQMPHILLDPTLSQGGDMVCPFFWPYNSIQLDSANMDNLGTIHIQDMAALRHANGDLTAITVTVFAWMEEVTLSAPTAYNVDGILPQSGTDEYGVSPAKKMAEQVVRASGMLSTKPIIGPYAKATQLVASLGLDLASALGFSKPNNVEPIQPMRPVTCGSLANTNVPDATQKLSLDCKQEVSIDPRTVGLAGEDEMDLVALACRESFLGAFSWVPGEQPGTMLWTNRVTPIQFVSMGTELIPALQMTPSAWVASPFAYWRGSMRVRVKIIGSAFHKGRLRVHYDPVEADGAPDMNVVYNHIIDIADCKDFTFTIGWAQDKSYARVQDIGNAGFASFGLSTVTPVTAANEFNNGSYCISVFTPLTFPNLSAEPITVAIFTSMCEDFEVQGPSSQIIQNLTFFNPNTAGLLAAEEEDDIVPESGVIQDGEDTCDPSVPVKDGEPAEAAMAAGMLSTVDQTPGIYFGESITNWKQVLKRYNMHRGWMLGSSNAANRFSIHDLAIADFPFYRGLASFGIDGSVDGPYNFCDMTMLNWVTPAYAGYRGAIRWKYTRVWGRESSSDNAYMQVTRTPVGNLGYLNFSTFILEAVAATARTTRAQISHTCSGATFTNSHFNPTVEAELPYQSNQRFYSGRRNNPNLINSEYPSHRLQVTTTERSPYIMSYCAAGEDFQTYFFVNVPRVWHIIADPTVT